MFNEINILRVLEYYALLNITFVSLSLVFLFFARKNPKILRKYNDFLDSLFVDKKQETEKPEEQKSEKTGEGKEEEKEDNPMLGISSFVLGIGDTYSCRLNAIERSGSIGKMKWFAENSFVGDFRKENVFHAAKAGRTRILCAREDDSFDSGAIIYDIKVVATDENWFAARLAEAVVEHKSKDAVVSSLLDRQVVSEDKQEGTMQFSGKEQEKALHLQSSKKGELQRVLYIMSPSRDTEKEIENGLDERFRRLKTGSGIKLWIHQFVDESRNEVDAYAFTKYSSSGQLLFGIGQAWRENGDTEEFLENASMAERMFGKLLKDEPLSQVEIKENLKEFFKSGSENAEEPNKKQNGGNGKPKPEKKTKAEKTKQEKKDDAVKPENKPDTPEKENRENSEPDAGGKDNDADSGGMQGDTADTVDFNENDGADIENFDDYNENI